MNPFTESTVARPLTQNPFRRQIQSSRREGDEPNEADMPASAKVDPCPGKAVHKKCAASASPGKCTPVAAIVLTAAGLIAGLGLGTPAPWVAGAVTAAALFVPHNAYAIDVNQANLDQLKSVRGIGSKTAQVIIDERKRGGDFESFSDLSDRVKGIGPKKAAALQQAGLTLGTSVKSQAGIVVPASKPSKKAGR